MARLPSPSTLSRPSVGIALGAEIRRIVASIGPYNDVPGARAPYAQDYCCFKGSTGSSGCCFFAGQDHCAPHDERVEVVAVLRINQQDLEHGVVSLPR